MALCLTAGDKLNLPHISEVVSTVFSGIYGSCLIPEDERLVLKLLHHLMQMQLTPATNPRKLLRQGNCAFSRLYKVRIRYLQDDKFQFDIRRFLFYFQAFSEELFSAKLFLTSALYEPILSLLTDDEIFLDIDPAKAIIR